jgi:PglZ domain-containing protein
MHQFHEYIAGQIVEKLKNSRVVVFYDPRKEFQPFVDELLAGGEGSNPIVSVAMREMAVSLARFNGSFIRLRAEVEPLVAVDRPEPLLIYLAGVERDHEGSLLMEIECAGARYEPQLKRHARNVLRHKYSDGQIDQMLERPGLTYSDIVRYLKQTEDGEQASILKNIFSREGWANLLIEWLADESKDKPIREKEAVGELFTMIQTRLGLELKGDDLAKARARTVRYALINEFRGALAGKVPASLEMIPAPPSIDHSKRVGELVEALRKQKPEAYIALADRVEKDLGLSAAGFQAGDLGAIGTFRFEERILLAWVASLIAERKYNEAMTVIERRAHSFWLNQQIERRAQWECCRLMAELGLLVTAIRPALSKTGNNPAQWVESYTAQDGWHKADQTHRQLEAWVAKMDDEPEAEKGLGVVRREYEETLKKMAVGFSQTFESAGWNVPDALHQTEIYSKVVAPGKARTAYFLVDAMRYEMGAELVSQLTEVKDLSIRPAIASLPTITEVGMAALLPGASASFSVIERKNGLAAKIEESVLSDVTDRMKLLKARVPGAIEMTLDKLLSTSPNKLQKSVEGAPLIVIRSQEIDALGEGGADFLARQTMDSVIGNLARAVRKLARMGVEAFVITADHGYQYSMSKDEDMRADNPGGKEVDLHRRCWAGQGGQMPAGSVRIPGAELGYETDLDFIFPKGLEVYRAQGGLSFHHGGFSLQELLIPVISFRATSNDGHAAGVKVTLEGLPAAITNRIFSVRVTVAADLFSTDLAPLRIVLMAEGEQAGQAEMAVNAEFDRQTGCVKLKPGVEASVGIMLTLEKCPTVKVVVLDPATDAVLGQSPELPVKVM